MKALFLAAVLASEGATGGSLGIGLDVLPEAYMFAARRLGTPMLLHLQSCTDTHCEWTLGDGVTFAADLSTQGLDVRRIEVRIDPKRVDAPEASSRYRQACLAIVALVAPKAPRDEQRTTALAIAAGETLALDTLGGDVTVYGTTTPSVGAKPLVTRCGASAV